MKNQITARAEHLGFTPIWDKVIDSVAIALDQEMDAIVRRHVTGKSILDAIKSIGAAGTKPPQFPAEQGAQDRVAELRKRVAAQAKAIDFPVLPDRAVDVLTATVLRESAGLVDQKVTPELLAMHYQRVREAIAARSAKPSAAPKRQPTDKPQPSGQAVPTKTVKPQAKPGVAVSA